MQLKNITLLFSIGYAYAFPTVTSRQTQGNSTCDVRKTTQLLGGIQENMFIQQQELQSLQTLQSLSTASNVPGGSANGTQSNFELNRISVVATQQKAIAVRERNQRLADDLSSPSAMGLAMVAQSQVSTMIDVQNLKEGSESDMKMLDELIKRVKDAMAQNAANLKMADAGCLK